MRLSLRSVKLRILLALCTSLPFLSVGRAVAQWVEPDAGKIELSDRVQIEQIDGVLRAQWQRAKTLLAEKQGSEALDVLLRLAEAPPEKLVEVGGGRYMPLRTWAQASLAGLPPDVLQVYRQRIDPAAGKWFEQGMAERNEKLLEDVVEQALASSYGDKALLALGEMALEAGDFAAARWYWERILPKASTTVSSDGDERRQNTFFWPAYPDSQLDPAAVRARLVLVSILEGERERARAELARFAQLHSQAQGRLGGREGRYVQLLETLLAESLEWTEQTPSTDWLTFAGDSARNLLAPPLEDIGRVVWRLPLRPPADARSSISAFPFFPVAKDGLVFLSDGERILGVRASDGQPAWGDSATVFLGDALAQSALQLLLENAFGAPRYTLTIFRDRLFARLGMPLTEFPADAAAQLLPSYLVALDLKAEGRLLWKVAAEEGWTFEGSPLCDGAGVYVAMRRQALQPQAFVACFDPDDGRLLWRRYVCSAESPARASRPLCSHNLLTLGRRVLYYNTQLGAVAAISTADGGIRWLTIYPRAREVDFYRPARHWRRDPCPALLHRGKLFVAPADAPQLSVFYAADGWLLWRSGSELEGVVELLAATDRWLLAAGERLYWISLGEDDFGRVKHVWPEGEPLPEHGRGVVAGRFLLQPVQDKLYLFDIDTAQPVKVFDLAMRGLRGGNLLPLGNQLLLATDSELIAVEAFPPKQTKPK